jgi:hypothetical protein
MTLRVSDRQGRDAALALLLFSATVVYLAALPLNLRAPDEAHALLAAKRIFDGEVMYRDIFDLSTPGWVYLIAGVFHVFGASLATARLTVAVIHGGSVVLVFLACRWLGVRRTLAVAAGVAYVVVCQPMFPVASYHWLATFLCLVLVVLCLRARTTAASAFVLGIGVGLLIAVHQQRGLAMGVGVALFVLAQEMLAWREGVAPRLSALARQLGAFAAGVLLIVGALLAVLVASAGVQPVWNALVIVPLVNYRGAIACAWGQHRKAGGRFALSPLLKYLPITMVVSVVPLLLFLRRAGSHERVRALTMLVLFCSFAILSIFYFPDVIHLAFIAPLFFIAWADAVEQGLRLLPIAAAHALAALAAGGVMLAGGGQLYGTLITLRAAYPVVYQSSFGRIDLPRPDAGRVWDQLRTALAADPSRELYVYPMATYMHLLVDARNPVRYAFIAPGGYTTDEQKEEIVDTLAAKRVRYVYPTGQVLRSEDAVARFIRAHYEPGPSPPPLGEGLWQLKNGADAPQG